LNFTITVFAKVRDYSSNEAKSQQFPDIAYCIFMNGIIFISFHHNDLFYIYKLRH